MNKERSSEGPTLGYKAPALLTFHLLVLVDVVCKPGLFRPPYFVVPH